MRVEMTHPLQAVLEQVGPSSCPTTHNFHCHTICSDGSLEPVSYTHLTLPTTPYV